MELVAGLAEAAKDFQSLLVELLIIELQQGLPEMQDM